MRQMLGPLSAPPEQKRPVDPHSDFPSGSCLASMASGFPHGCICFSFCFLENEVAVSPGISPNKACKELV